MALLTSVVKIQRHAHLFSSDDVLRQIVEKIVLPNMTMRSTPPSLLKSAKVFEQKDIGLDLGPDLWWKCKSPSWWTGALLVGSISILVDRVELIRHHRGEIMSFGMCGLWGYPQI